MKNRAIQFAVDNYDRAIVRVVTGTNHSGPTRYVHRCDYKNYVTVAGLVETSPTLKLKAIAEANGLPYTQVNVALEFMKERGCLGSGGRRTWLVSNFTFEDAMLEYHAAPEYQHVYPTNH